MTLGDKINSLRVRELRGESAAYNKAIERTSAPIMAFVGDTGHVSRDITETIATEFASGATLRAASLAEDLELSRAAVTKRIERFHDLGWLRYTHHGWVATIRGLEVLNRVIAEE
jgi:hypothetical protein